MTVDLKVSEAKGSSTTSRKQEERMTNRLAETQHGRTSNGSNKWWAVAAMLLMLGYGEGFSPSA